MGAGNQAVDEKNHTAGRKTAPVVHTQHGAAKLAVAAREGGLGITAGSYLTT